MSVADEIPKSKQGIINYMNYCDGQIKENLKQNKLLRARYERAQEKLEAITKGEDGEKQN